MRPLRESGRSRGTRGQSDVESGPVRARLLVERVYELPAYAIGNERVYTVDDPTTAPAYRGVVPR